MREKLYLLPVYIGSLKYYEKLIPYLKDAYDVRFLFVRGDDKRREQMIDHCEEKGYTYELLDRGLVQKVSIPFISAVINRYLHNVACREFLRERMPLKLIVPRIASPFSKILKEANLLKVETIFLQWALAVPDDFLRDRTLTLPFFKRAYFRTVYISQLLFDVLYRGFAYIRINSIPQKIGVIDKDSSELFADRWNIHKDRFDIVGMADVQIAYDIKKLTREDGTFKGRLEKKYNINSEKHNILILAQAHHLKGVMKTTKTKQVEQYRDMIHFIRRVFDTNEASILFKLHPSDTPELYESYKTLGVTIFGDEAETHELLAISDLCIANPWTSANYSVLGSGTPAIFINFFKQQALNQAMRYYNIKHTITDEAEFVQMLEKFKDDNLEIQYDNSTVDINSINKIVALINRK